MVVKFGGKAPSKNTPSHDRDCRLLVSNEYTLRRGAPPPSVAYDRQEPKTSFSLGLRGGCHGSSQGQPVACPQLYLKVLMKPSRL